MEEDGVIAPTVAVSLSAGITALFVATITIVSEFNAPFTTYLTNTFGHHWIGKSVISTGVFIVFSGILWGAFRRRHPASARAWVYASIVLVLISAMVIFGFFAYLFIRPGA